jgi:hypothetical protein
MTSRDTTYSTYDPVPFKTIKPEIVGKTKNIEITDTKKIYDSTRTNGAYVSVNHRGYLYIPQTGEYSFSFPAADDKAYLWLGPTAYTGWDGSNQVLWSTAAATTSYVHKATFQQGEYVPLRIMYANAGDPAQLKFEIKAPDGTVIMDSATKDSRYLVRFSCDHVTAPRFPPYGSET